MVWSDNGSPEVGVVSCKKKVVRELAVVILIIITM